MPKSIDLGGDVFLDASAVTMNSTGRTLKQSLPTMQQYSETIAHNNTRVFVMTPGSVGIFFTASSYADTRSAYVFFAETSGNVRTSALESATGVTVSTSSSGLSIQNNSANDTSMFVGFFVFTGHVSLAE